MAQPFDRVPAVPLLHRMYPRVCLRRFAAVPRDRFSSPTVLQAFVPGPPEALASLDQIQIILPESHPLWAALDLTPLPAQRVLKRRRRL